MWKLTSSSFFAVIMTASKLELFYLVTQSAGENTAYSLLLKKNWNCQVIFFPTLICTIHLVNQSFVSQYFKEDLSLHNCRKKEGIAVQRIKRGHFLYLSLLSFLQIMTRANSAGRTFAALTLCPRTTRRASATGAPSPAPSAPRPSPSTATTRPTRSATKS